MQEMDRSFYDMKTRIHIQEYGLDLISGFATAVASYEDRLLLCAEITHKLLHRKSIFDLMGSFYQNSRNESEFREKCLTGIVGRIVMTT